MLPLPPQLARLATAHRTRQHRQLNLAAYTAERPAIQRPLFNPAAARVPDPYHVFEEDDIKPIVYNIEQVGSCV